MAPHRRRRRRRLYRRAADWLLRYQGSPYNVAMGFAVGLFVALTPTVGIQMALGAFIAHLFRANRALPVALAWISNPLTMGPLYYFNYRVGLLFLPGDETAGREFIDSISGASLTDPSSWWEAIKLMGRELWGVAGVLWAGSLVVATIAAVIAYPIVHRMVVRGRAKLSEVSAMPSMPPPRRKKKNDSDEPVSW